MPVHNALPYLDQAIESILGQSLADFEFVILDDASTDGSRERLEYWTKLDPRIDLLTVDENLGPVRSSNMVARAATAPFVARMDADDISYPDRLAQEFQLLREDPNVGVVASLCDMINVSGKKMRDAEFWRLSRRSVFVPFAHGSMMYRREVFDEVGGYRDECEYWEDQDLVLRMASISKVLVIPRPLYRVRQSMTSTRILSSQERLERALDRAYRAIDRFESSKDYEKALDARDTDRRKLDPRVFIALGSMRLWAHKDPRLFLRCLETADISFNLRSACALVWTAWASISPSTLRGFMMLLLKTRNRFAPSRLTELRAVQWNPTNGIRRIRVDRNGP